LEDLEEIYEKMMARVFEDKFDIRAEGEISGVDRVSASARNYFVSNY